MAGGGRAYRAVGKETGRMKRQGQARKTALHARTDAAEMLGDGCIEAEVQVSLSGGPWQKIETMLPPRD